MTAPRVSVIVLAEPSHGSPQRLEAAIGYDEYRFACQVNAVRGPVGSETRSFSSNVGYQYGSDAFRPQRASSTAG